MAHWLNGHECEQTLRNGRQGNLESCYSPWGHKESDKLTDCTATTKSHLL